MFEILGKIPTNVNIALSGGVDSMVALDFLRKGKRDITALYFDHGTEHGKNSAIFLKDWCNRNSINLKIGKIESDIPNGVSKEAFWREQRYNWLESVADAPVITAHHLDDVIETWIFSSLHGNPKLIKSSRGIFIRPFLLCDKQSILSWAERKNLEWIDDPSNNDTKFMRNLIRHNIVPEALKVNPGLPKTLKKKIISAFKEHE
jgi:tRNA(Ile)-lysidine synthase